MPEKPAEALPATQALQKAERFLSPAAFILFIIIMIVEAAVVSVVVKATSVKSDSHGNSHGGSHNGVYSQYMEIDLGDPFLRFHQQQLILNVSIALQLNDKLKDVVNIKKQLESQKKYIRDRINTIIDAKNPEEMVKTQFKSILKGEVLRALNKEFPVSSGEDIFRAVLFYD